MTEAIDTSRIELALEMIDRDLVGLCRRELLSATEVTDLLLDVRSLLVSSKAETVGAH